MRPRRFIELDGQDLLVFFEYNKSFNAELRRRTHATNIRFDWKRRAYRLSANAANSPEVCHHLREFAIEHDLNFSPEAAIRLGAFVTKNALKRIQAEVAAIREASLTELPNPGLDGAMERHDRLHHRLVQLDAMCTWPEFGTRPVQCKLVSPGSLVRIRFSDGEEQTVVISAVELPGYDRVSPFQPVGREIAVSQVGQSWKLDGGRGSVTIVGITD